MGSYVSDRVVCLPGCYKSQTLSFVQLTQVCVPSARDMTSHRVRPVFNGSVCLFQTIYRQQVTGWLCCSLRWDRGFIRMEEISSVCRYNIELAFSKQVYKHYKAYLSNARYSIVSKLRGQSPWMTFSRTQCW